MRKFLLLILPILLISCEARLDDDTRALFKTRVVDVAGNPIANMKVSATTLRSFDLIGQDVSKFSRDDDDFLLGQGITNDNGEVEFVMLVDGSFFINFNTQNFFANKVSVSRQELDDELFLNIPETILKESSEVEIDFINTSGTTDEFNADFQFENVDCDLIFSNNTLTQDQECIANSNQFNRFNRNPNDGDFNLRVFYPSTLEVSYRDSSGTILSRSFSVNNPNERYEIQY